jgi:hypothetical protein
MEVKQILVIHKDDNGMGVPLKVMAPFSECSDNSEQLLVKDLVIALSGVQGLGKVTAGMILAIVISL